MTASRTQAALHPSRTDWHLVRRNGSLAVGIVLLSLLALFIIVGNLIVDTEWRARCRCRALQPPSWDYPFGTDRQGRDLLAVMVAGTPLTLRIGFIAGILGVGVGTVLAFIAGYYRGMVDTVIRSVVDIGLTVPGLLVLIIIAVSISGGLTVNQMAIVVASLAWLNPTRTIRAQVLTSARARLRRDGAAQRHERPGDHRARADAEPAALSRGDARQRGLAPRSWPRSGWKRSGSARWTRRRSA